MRGCTCRVEPCSTHRALREQQPSMARLYRKRVRANASISTPCMEALVESSHARLIAHCANSSRAWLGSTGSGFARNAAGHGPALPMMASSRSTPCVDALVESSHARLIAHRANSSRAWLGSTEIGFARTVAGHGPALPLMAASGSTPCVDALVASSHARLSTHPANSSRAWLVSTGTVAQPPSALRTNASNKASVCSLTWCSMPSASRRAVSGSTPSASRKRSTV